MGGKADVSLLSQVKTGLSMSSRLSEYILNSLRRKSLWNFLKIKFCGEECLLKIGRVYSFAGVVKTHDLLFHNFFRT